MRKQSWLGVMLLWVIVSGPASGEVLDLTKPQFGRSPSVIDLRKQPISTVHQFAPKTKSKSKEVRADRSKKDDEPSSTANGKDIASGVASGPSGCVEELRRDNPRLAVEVCSTALKEKNHSDKERARLLKIRARANHRLYLVYNDKASLSVVAADYEAALKLDPKNPELYLRRGWVARDEKDFESAMIYAAKALELRPEYPEVYDLASTVHMDVRDFDTALELSRESVRLDPTNLNSGINLVITYKLVGDVNAAIKQLEVFLKQSTAEMDYPAETQIYLVPTSYRILGLLNYGELLHSVGRVDEASKAFDEAVNRDPSALTYAVRGRFHQSKRSPIDESAANQQLASQDFEKSLTYNPDYWFPLFRKAQLIQRDNPQQAEALIAKAIPGFPINGEMRWQRALLLRKLNNVPEAIEEALRAFKVDPGYMMELRGMLASKGYYVPVKGADPRSAMYDAARACMLDEQCG